ncbi:aspartyl-phosphate phosphatase Spo0E family protein [Bacillus sp. B15-48]|uniref:aspartyl-phosphate phosphatase Spo0E family protein n=1 Tax=Bacillus sp. B15-48 TaxID=1548601 RepID=UPI0031B831A6
MYKKNHPLLYQIQLKREEMETYALEKGYNSMETIVCSQELDKLIYEYQLTSQNHQQQDKIQIRKLFRFFNQPQSMAGSLDT